MTTRAKAVSTTMLRPLAAIGGLALGAGLILTQTLPLPAQEAIDPETPPTVADTTAQETSRPATFSELAEQVSPAVVNITTSTTVSRNAGPQGIIPEGSPFEDFFREFQDQNPNGGPRRSSALGSGFVISADGYIVTNNHVIEAADEIEVEFYAEVGERNRVLPAEVVGTDPNTDIALLKVEVEDGEELPFVEFGDSNGPDAEVGDWVMAMGNPLGQGFSVSAGIVSARSRALQGTYDDYIQTDAAINRGNSGGPLFNMNGEVIGVNTAILSPNGGSIGIGFAMSAAVVTNVVDQLREFGETRRGWLGVRIQDVTPDMVDAIEGLTGPEGALVTDVPEGPALEAGMESGDVITEFDGTAVADTRELVRIVGNSPVGEEVPVTVLRNGEEVTLTVTLGRREESEAAIPASAEVQDEPVEMLGLTVAPITPDLAEEFEITVEEGLVVTEVDPESDAADKGILPGDVITEAGQQQVASVAEFEQQVEAAEEAGRKSLLLLIRRGGDPRFVALVLDPQN